MKVANYEIVKMEVYKTTDKHCNGIAFGIHPSENCPARYATWEYTENHDTGDFSAFWGHYFDNFTEAQRDFHIRLANYYDKPWEVM